MGLFESIKNILTMPDEGEFEEETNEVAEEKQKENKSEEDDAYLTDPDALTKKLNQQMSTSGTQPDEIAQDSLTDEEVANAIKGYFSDTTINDLKTAIYNYREIEAWCKTPILSEESFNKLMDIVELAGELPSRVSYSKIVTTKFANNVK